MAVKIRLSRVGRKNRPTYRIVVADSRTPRDGKYLAMLGHYNPHLDNGTAQVEMDLEGFKKWMGQGAQPTEGLRKIVLKQYPQYREHFRD